MTKFPKKPTIGIISLTCCEGCQFAILDLGKRLLEIFEHYDLGEFGLVEDQRERDYYDIAIVEGSPITGDNIKRLKEMRKKSKFLIALGTCAHIGCVQGIKNYVSKDQKIKYVYPNIKKIDNPKIVPISHYVKVDFIIPGCPINNEEFAEILLDIKDNKLLPIPDRPVCYECPLAQAGCLLQKNIICLGPVTRAGCSAICTRQGQQCLGCRGPIDEPNLDSLREVVLRFASEKKFNHAMQVFGIQEMLEAQAKKASQKKFKK
ncbi:hypothetical protein KKG41_01895 [Patescibacteria group bacterium]|nr:hypothetical protein [Patescibacteria group bacterium]MBU1890401.1 hypothetical protein [Patescibacteria group bacterium]